jgi:hypothetical protein
MSAADFVRLSRKITSKLASLVAEKTEQWPGLRINREKFGSPKSEQEKAGAESAGHVIPGFQCVIEGSGDSVPDPWDFLAWAAPDHFGRGFRVPLPAVEMAGFANSK